MSLKIILNTEQKQLILDFIMKSYQCTIKDILDEFNTKFPINRQALIDAFGKEYLYSITFHGCKDSTKAKLRACSSGKKHTDEQKQKISTSLKNKKRSKEQILNANEGLNYLMVYPDDYMLFIEKIKNKEI